MAGISTNRGDDIDWLCVSLYPRRPISWEGDLLGRSSRGLWWTVATQAGIMVPKRIASRKMVM